MTTDEQSLEAGEPGHHPLAFWHWALHWQVLLAILLGITIGGLNGRVFAPEVRSVVYEGLDLIGTLFMNALQMLVVPLVGASIVSSIAGLGSQSGFGRLGGKTLLYYLSTSLIAVLIGLVMVNLIAPGEALDLDAAAAVAVEDSSEAANLAKLQQRTAGRDAADMLNVFKQIIPKNIVAAAANMQMLGLIFFSILFGFFITKAKPVQRELLQNLAEGVYEVMIHMTFLVLRFLPLGVLCLIAKTMSDSFARDEVGERLIQLLQFAFTVLVALGLHLFVVMPLILRFIAHVSPVAHFRAMGPALITAFSTASSSATLPMTMDCVEHRAGVSKKVTSFVLPIGATVNMDGTALYECVAVMFLAQLSGIDLGAAQQFTIVLLALLTSIGVAGIPSASLVAIVIILSSVNASLPDGQEIPMEALAVILVFDRLLDMCRTMVNVFGDSCGAVTIAATEGESVLVDEQPEAA